MPNEKVTEPRAVASGIKAQLSLYEEFAHV